MDTTHLLLMKAIHFNDKYLIEKNVMQNLRNFAPVSCLRGLAPCTEPHEACSRRKYTKKITGMDPSVVVLIRELNTPG